MGGAPPPLGAGAPDATAAWRFAVAAVQHDAVLWVERGVPQLVSPPPPGFLHFLLRTVRARLLHAWRDIPGSQKNCKRTN